MPVRGMYGHGKGSYRQVKGSVRPRTFYLLACQVGVTAQATPQVLLLLSVCDVFRTLINSLVCWFSTYRPGHVHVFINLVLLLLYSGHVQGNNKGSWRDQDHWLWYDQVKATGLYLQIVKDRTKCLGNTALDIKICPFSAIVAGRFLLLFFSFFLLIFSDVEFDLITTVR